MYRIKTIFSIILLGMLCSFSSDDLPDGFTKLLARTKMNFEKPGFMKDTTIISNKLMAYNYAMKLPGKPFEVRFAIIPADSMEKVYLEKAKNHPATDYYSTPQNLYYKLFKSIMLTLSETPIEIREMKPDDVKLTLKADWAATSTIEVNKAFSPNYKYCIAVVMHKDYVGDAYCFYLSDNLENFEDFVPPVSDILQFKQ